MILLKFGDKSGNLRDSPCDGLHIFVYYGQVSAMAETANAR